MNQKHVTYKEIRQQPEVWESTFYLVKQQQKGILSFLKDSFKNNNSDVILTGAGSSFFVAEASVGIFQKNSGLSSKAISSTELVTHPELYINKNKHTLLISFARSGNSPESIAAIDTVEKITNKISHLIITCNEKGKLAMRKYKGNAYVFNLPKETNDKGLAMTSSVSSMILATTLISNIKNLDKYEIATKRMADFGQFIIDVYDKEIEEVAQTSFSRAVFLGSGQMLGIAHEAHLKLQELTDGKIICKFDSFLGFRHGPKAVVNNDTCMIYLMSNNDYVRKYEKDLIVSVQKEQNPKCGIIISEFYENFDNINLNISGNSNNKKLPEELLSICELIPIQLFAYYKSINLGLNPDSPSESGAIHRVVQGVTIYDYNLKNETVQTQEL